MPALTEDQIIAVLQSSLYPGAHTASIRMVLGYCQAAGLDPFQKPLYIVPMWDPKAGQMRDVVMPGIGMYRTQAARTGCAGVTEPDFGPDVTKNIGGQEVTYPQWCRVTVKRRQHNGAVDEFTAREFWVENYAVKGGKDKSIAPNAMWTKRPYGQLAKCAEAQALRKAFPEIGSQPTAEEMEGKELVADTVAAPPHGPQRRSAAPATMVDEVPQDEQTPRHEDAESPTAPSHHPADTKPPLSDASGVAGGITGGQVGYLRNKLKAAGLAEELVCDRYQVTGIEMLSPGQFDELKSELLARS